ncbi:UNVERIFIED_CONTAM: hypothetical protein FKN15_067834 [Acipenser sinensis]
MLRLVTLMLQLELVRLVLGLVRLVLPLLGLVLLLLGCIQKKLCPATCIAKRFSEEDRADGHCCGSYTEDFVAAVVDSVKN